MLFIFCHITDISHPVRTHMAQLHVAKTALWSRMLSLTSVELLHQLALSALSQKVSLVLDGKPDDFSLVGSLVT